MPTFTQFRHPDLSLFQSAVDEVVARAAADADAIIRPDPGHSMVAAAAKPPVAGDPPSTDSLAGQLGYCASLARSYGEAKLAGNEADASRYYAMLTDKLGTCDPRWIDTAVKYKEFLFAKDLTKDQIPYRTHKSLSDFVIDGKLPANARVALLGDWGTGQPEAKTILAQIARKNPDVLIHMGDVYYAGTDFEMENYFYNLLPLSLDLSKVPVYTLCGNHDMFSGGAPYYRLLDKLGQPASYFCLRNDAWQFLAIDTGFYDNKPDGTVPTYLHDTEVEWLADKIQNRGGRRTILLSHHQLFTAFEDICGKGVNDHLNQQLSPLLPAVDMWLWGHEHNLVVYERYMGVLARCIGHGAFPMSVNDVAEQPKFPEVPATSLRLDLDSKGEFHTHGYVIMDLTGASATLSYYQDTDEVNPQFTETLAAPAATASSAG
jgi:3',5'-cyclic AMP phosphodiesterase CpdA